MTVEIKIVMRAKEVKDNNFFASVKKFMRPEHTSLTSFTSFTSFVTIQRMRFITEKPISAFLIDTRCKRKSAICHFCLYILLRLQRDKNLLK